MNTLMKQKNTNVPRIFLKLVIPKEVSFDVNPLGNLEIPFIEAFCFYKHHQNICLCHTKTSLLIINYLGHYIKRINPFFS